MKKGFWDELKKPIFTLAPMADVTDAAFRRVIAKYGKPDVMFTEFVSADGLLLAGKEGKQKLMKDLEYSEGERPIVAQFFTGIPEHIERAVEIALELGFDGVDINMGCPDRSIESQGAGAALIKDYKKATELIEAVKHGVSGRIPVSVKTRLGYSKIEELEKWLPVLLETELAAVLIHARTRKEMSKVPAHWDQIKRAVEIRNESGSETLIIGNGDVMNLEDAHQKIKETGCDGIMFGKAVFGNPWLFDREKKEVSVKERLEVMIEHTKLFEELLGKTKPFHIMKKHYKAYVSGWNGAKELRVRLMESNNANEVEKIVKEYLRTMT